jgi:hypothetical protein
MTLPDQRKAAIQLASKLNAPKTLLLLKDINSCYQDILPVALSEIGEEKFVNTLLENDPVWSLNALRFLPNINHKRDALVVRSAVLNQPTIITPFAQAMNGLQVHTLPSISALKLSLVSGVGWAANSFTMWWSSPFLPSNQTWQPMQGQSDAGQWKKSGSLNVGDSATMSCSDFVISSNTPLNPGDIVTMVVDIKCNSAPWSATNFLFCYSPDSAATAAITGTGPVGSPSFSWQMS